MTRAVSYDISDEQQRSTAEQVCAAALGRGEVVFVDVDGQACLIADAFSAAGIAGLMAARNRGRGAAAAVLVRDASVVQALFSEVDFDARALMRNHWPGPLTLIGTPTASLRWDLGAAGELVGLAVRMPRDPFVAGLVAATGPCAYLAVPSVTSRADAQSDMGDLVACYATYGPAESALPAQAKRTSIVDVRSTPAVLLREGAFSFDDLVATCPGLQRLVHDHDGEGDQ